MPRTIRVLTLADIEMLLAWAAAEGWNPGLADAVAFQSVDPEGFIGAFVDETLVAAISAVAYDVSFGFIGLYICHPDWRGQGHGKAVWDAGMAYLGQRTIGLDGVPEQQSNYASMGFRRAYDTVRMTGGLQGLRQDQPQIVTIGPDEVGQLLAFDSEAFPAGRAQFLRHWLAAPNAGLALRRDNRIAAYAVVRPCRDGRKLGPLFAQNSADAEALLLATLIHGDGQLQIDVPSHQTTFLSVLTGLGFQPGFTTARMYRGTPPEIWASRVFGVTSLELG